jgi:HK97 family phage major capsid protein
MSWRDKVGQAHKLFQDAKAILNNPAANAEEKAKVPQMLADGQALKVEALQLKEIEDAGIEQLLGKAEEKQANTPATQPSQFKRWGEFLEAVGLAEKSATPDPRLVFFKEAKDASGHERKDMSGQTAEGGGALIPSEFQAQLMSVAGEASIVRKRATIIPLRRRQLDIPVLDQTGTTAGEGHWFGGLAFHWAEEATADSGSDPKFKSVSLVARELIGLTRASNSLLDDSAISLEAFLSGPLGFAGGVAWMEDYAFLRGSGVGKPLGVINAGCTIEEGRVAAGDVQFDDIIDMLEHFLPSSKGVWVISQSLMAKIISLSGPASHPSFVFIPNGRDGIPSTLFGFPIEWSEKPPRIGTKGDIGLYDFRYYLVGDRQATTVESTRFEKWAENKTSWKVVHRVDGQPWLSAPLTLQDGITQVSPFVVLGAAVGS